MGYQRTFVIVAKSKKYAGACVAGKEIAGAQRWVRPVSARPSGELNIREMSYVDSRSPTLLDVVTVSLVEPRQHNYQPENHIIDARYYWDYQRRITWDVALRIADAPNTVWTNNFSTRYGHNDQVPLAMAPALQSSLLLLHVQDFRITVGVEWPDYNANRKVRGAFTYNGIDYTLAVTDPFIEDYYLRKSDGAYDLGEALLCISLAEPYKEHAYKLIAGVIFPDR